MLIHPWDAATKAEWTDLLRHADFGQLIAAGSGEDYPVVVPAHFLYDGGDEVLLHLARPNPVWQRLEENDRVVLAVVADYAYIEAAWNVDRGIPVEHGVPTSYYSAVQLRGRARVVDDPEEKLAILRAQLGHFEPEDSTRTPPSLQIESDRRQLPGIRGVVITIEEVLAKQKYGGNRSVERRRSIADHLAERDGHLDAEARGHLLRRTDRATEGIGKA